MPFGYVVGDHRMFVLDIMLESLIGKRPTKIVCPALRRLNSNVPHCIDVYNKSMESNIVQHCLIKRLHEVHVSNWTQEDKERRVCKIDREARST